MGLILRPFSKTICINQLKSHLKSIGKRFSSTSTTSETNSLSARMSFVFDQIDSIDKERSQKDETLERIRAWREAKKEKQPIIEQQQQENVYDDFNKEKEKGLLSKGVELVHPWPEWIELMERLVRQNYFDCRRKDEDKIITDLGFGIMEEVVDEGLDFTRDWKTVLTAALNFGKDRFDILKSLLKKDIQLLVGYGCPSADKKVVFSAKLLRKHVHLDEGDVCSSCSLRSSCERAYLLTNKEDEARTIDIMRLLMTYGFDPVNGSVVNESLLNKKQVKTAIRKLLHEVVKLSAIPIDPNLPPPIIKRPPPKVKQTPPPPKRRVGRDDVEMKKGDWLCPKCDFMNFAKNTVCLQCDAKRPKRQLLPGEWECPECKFLNYRRNMACFECECKRPPDEFTENQMQERQRGPRTQLSNRKEVSDAWNFDFDENESDGADVAAFEYADSRKLDEDNPTTTLIDEEKMPHNFFRSKRPHELEMDSGSKRQGVGFDDFDDDEEDDVNSYELDMDQNYNNKPKVSSSVNFSDLEVDSESEDVHEKGVSSFRRASKHIRHGGVDFNSDDDLPIHPNWKSSHVADGYRHKSRGIKYGSDEDSDLSDDDFRRKHKGRTNDYRKSKDYSFDEKSRGRKASVTDRRKSSSNFSRGDNNARFRNDVDFKSHRRDDKHNRRSNGGEGDSYLDAERFRRPRVNVR